MNYNMNDGSFIKAFKKINRIRFFAIVICILVAFASSCSLKRDLRRSKKPADVNAAVDDTRKESDIVEEAKDEPKEETKEETKDADADESKSDSVKVEFIFTNACKEDIGMISILDPVSS